MILTITSTHPPATDLGYLLHKNPARSQAFEFGWGQARVFYPEASPERCTAALLLEIDPIRLVRREVQPGFPLAQYVNDRPYVASSFMSVAIANVFGTALRGRSKERPELARASLPLEATLAALPCRGGEALLRKLFEPLGYQVSVQSRLLDKEFPEWGESDCLSLGIRGTARLSDVLSHLYVLIPVLDDGKHYWVAQPEVDKLLERGSTWLADHPERDLISRRYLKHRPRLVDEALARLSEEGARDQGGDEDAADSPTATEASLREQRIAAVVSELAGCGAQRVLDLGCGSGALLEALLKNSGFTKVVGVDVSWRALSAAARRLDLDRMAPRQRERIDLIQGSLTYRDQRLVGYDAAALVEVVEHMDRSRLRAFERVLFEFGRPGNVVLTTPNAEHNALYESLPGGRLRHEDHRFEWSRQEFAAWADAVAQRHSYSVSYRAIGEEHPVVGPPTQMAVFSR